MPKINFIDRQSDDDLACFTIHDSRTILKVFLEEKDLKALTSEIAAAKKHLVERRNLNAHVARAMKRTRFPRRKSHA
jgi:hypothetical protein